MSQLTWWDVARDGLLMAWCWLMGIWTGHNRAWPKAFRKGVTHGAEAQTLFLQREMLDQLGIVVRLVRGPKPPPHQNN